MLYENIYLALFTALKNSLRNVISGIHFTRHSLYPVCVKSGMGLSKGAKSEITSIDEIFGKKRGIVP